MGVYFDYFRAADDDVARATHELVGGPLGDDPSGPFDGVSTKGVFADPHLEQLIARASGTPYTRGPRTSTGLWPPPDTPPPVDETSPWLTDPSVERLETRVRDALADIPADQVHLLADGWAEDISQSVDDAATTISALSALCRRARESGQDLYCWSTL
ncbi:MAG TPA: hypothetical protein VFE07_11285 [Marmoricola sp.]|jgi:hypothetical protein|nr:hypothetical protein [Marmoricola sp.]